MEPTRATTASRRSPRAGLVALALGAGLAVAGPVQAQTAAAGEASAVPAPARHVPRHHPTGSLEARLTLLTRALQLDSRQQAELRKVLEDQRDELRRTWNDTSVPGADRITATQAISDRTADRIRALLNEEQRKRYNPPRPPRPATAGSARPSVDDWMSPGRAR